MTTKLIGKIRHKTYPVREINGVVFVFIGDFDPPPPVEQDTQPKSPANCLPMRNS